MLAGIEVFHGGGLGEAEALGLVVRFAGGSFGVGREGSDASGPVEEGGAEVWYGVAYGGDAAKASDDDSIQCCSPLGDLVSIVSSCGRVRKASLEGGTPLLPGRKYPAISSLWGMSVCKNVITKGLRLNMSK